MNPDDIFKKVAEVHEKQLEFLRSQVEGSKIKDSFYTCPYCDGQVYHKDHLWRCQDCKKQWPETV